MTPPAIPAQDPPGPAAAATPAVSVHRVCILRHRADFLRAAGARRQAMPGFLLQARQRAAGEPAAAPIRVGFTCSRKVGNSVARNRARRRLREIARMTLPEAGRPGWDYVLVGRPGVTATRDFARLRADLLAALVSIHAPAKARPGPDGGG